jgi:hypothetical protein
MLAAIGVGVGVIIESLWVQAAVAGRDAVYRIMQSKRIIIEALPVCAAIALDVYGACGLLHIPIGICDCVQSHVRAHSVEVYLPYPSDRRC